jgi:hypothetical protein
MSQPTALSRRKLVLAPAATLLAIAGLTLLFAPNLGAALKRVGSIPLSAFALTLALGIAAIGLRAEIWRLCLRALGSVCQSRTDLHACSAMTFVANQANHYVGPFARIGLLRRLYGERAPRPLQLVACDLSVLLCEIGVVAVILAGSVALAGLPWWMPVAGVALAAVGLTGLAGARRRFAGHPSSDLDR